MPSKTGVAVHSNVLSKGVESSNSKRSIKVKCIIKVKDRDQGWDRLIPVLVTPDEISLSHIHSVADVTVRNGINMQPTVRGVNYS